MWASFALIMVHLDNYKPEVVLWEVYYKFVHDLIIICFALHYAYKSKTHPIGAITGIGFAAYFCGPIMIRLYLAIEYFERYKSYRSAINEDNYKIALMMLAFVILLSIYAVKLYYDRKRRKNIA